VIHPFHPLSGREFDLVVRKKNWAEDRVFVFDDNQLVSIPAGFTDLEPPDPFVAISAGRSMFRVDDLLALADLLENLRPAQLRRGVKRISPHM
jgi:hypothetical protein